VFTVAFVEILVWLSFWNTFHRAAPPSNIFFQAQIDLSSAFWDP